MAQAGTPGGGSVSGIQQELYTYAADTGSANTYVITQSPSPTIIAGSIAVFKAAHANTGASTLNVNGGGAVAIKKQVSIALGAGDIAVGQIIVVVYDGTNWQLVGGSGDIAAQYVLGKPDANLTNAQVNSYAYNSPDCAATSPNTMDDEFDDTTGNSGTGNGLNARWTWLNQGVATIAYNNSCAVMDSVAATQNEKAIYQSTPSTPWEVTVKLATTGSSSNMWGGVFLEDSISGKIIDFFDSSQYGLQVFYMNSITSFNTQAFNSGVLAQAYNFCWMYFRIKDDGVNLTFSWSLTGVPPFYQLFQASRTAFLTNGPNRVGLVVDGWMGSSPFVKLFCDRFWRSL
jgi:hypothetical protein